MSDHPIELYDDDKFYQRYRHHGAPRTAKNVSELSVTEYGNVFDTIMDLIHGTLICGSCSQLPTQSDPISITPSPENFPPAYVYNFFDDYRYGGSFFRGDRHAANPDEPSAPKVLHGVAKFADKTHLDSRKLPTQLIKNVEWPPDVLAAKQEFQQTRTYYEGLVKEYQGHNNIPASLLTDIDGRIDSFLTNLRAALDPSNLKIITVELSDGSKVHLNNEPSFLTDRSEANTALVLFQFSDPRMIITDLEKVPERYAEFSIEAIGAESLLTDLLQQLLDQSSPDGAAFQGSLGKFRENLKTHVRDHARDLQMLGAFHRTLDIGYERAYDDIDHLLRICELPTQINAIESPKEAAVLTYAAARFIQNHSPKPLAVTPTLLSIADQLSHAESMAGARDILERNEPTLRVAKDFAHRYQHNAMLETLSLLDPTQRGVSPSASKTTHFGASRA